MEKAPCKSDWTLLESKGVDCGDKRLDRRFATLLQTMAKTPGASIPKPVVATTPKSLPLTAFSQTHLSHRMPCSAHTQSKQQSVSPLTPPSS